MPSEPIAQVCDAPLAADQLNLARSEHRACALSTELTLRLCLGGVSLRAVPPLLPLLLGPCHLSLPGLALTAARWAYSIATDAATTRRSRSITLSSASTRSTTTAPRPVWKLIPGSLPSAACWSMARMSLIGAE